MEFIDMVHYSQDSDFDLFRGVYGSEFTNEMIAHSVQIFPASILPEICPEKT